MTPFALFPYNRERNVSLGETVLPGALRREQRAEKQNNVFGKKNNPQVKLNLSVFTQISYAENKLKKSPRSMCTVLSFFFFLVLFLLFFFLFLLKEKL